MVPLAYKEGVITGMEFLWSHGAVIQAGEFRHGPLEIVESGVPFLFLVPTDSSRVITQRALKFVEKWKGTAIVLVYADFAGPDGPHQHGLGAGGAGALCGSPDRGVCVQRTLEHEI